MEHRPIFFAGYPFNPVETAEDLSLAVAKLVIQITEMETEANYFPDGSPAHLLMSRKALILKIIMESLQHEFGKKELRVTQKLFDLRSADWFSVEQQIFAADHSHILAIQKLLARGNGACRVSKVIMATPGLVAGLGKKD